MEPTLGTIFFVRSGNPLRERDACLQELCMYFLREQVHMDKGLSEKINIEK